MIRKIFELFSFLFLSIMIIGTQLGICGELKLNSNSCNIAQTDINKMSEIVATYPAQEKIGKREAFGKIFENNLNRLNTLDKDPLNSSDYLKMEPNLVMGVMDWAESIIFFHSAKNFGSYEKNKKVYFGQIYQLQQKEKGINKMCPHITFPNFKYWNRIIQNNN